MKIVYHGSPSGDIEVFKPHKSTHNKECVYATDNRTIALLFMSHGNGDYDTVINYSDGKVQLVERREGVLDNLYNKSGYLYELDGSTFKHYDYLWSPEVISFEDSLKPIKKSFIENIYEELEKEEELGNIEIFRYPDRPKFMPLDNSDLIDKAIEFERMGHRYSIDRMLKIYPELKERAFAKMDKPEHLFIIARDVDSFDKVTAYDSKIDAMFNSKMDENDCDGIFIREEGAIDYTFEDGKFTFEKGGLNLEDDFYIYEIDGDYERISSHVFNVKNVKILSKEKFDLNNFIVKEDSKKIWK